jgi:hypothetical protein
MGDPQPPAVFKIFPRRKIGESQRTCDGERPPILLSREILSSVSDMHISRAAATLGLSVTSLRKACRVLGMRRPGLADPYCSEERFRGERTPPSLAASDRRSFSYSETRSSSFSFSSSSAASRSASPATRLDNCESPSDQNVWNMDLFFQPPPLRQGAAESINEDLRDISRSKAPPPQYASYSRKRHQPHTFHLCMV